MLTITDAAWTRLSEITETRAQVNELRLTFRKGRVKCRRAVRRTTDHSVEQDGRPVLVMTPGVAKRLSNRTLDAPATKQGPRLRLCNVAQQTVAPETQNQTL